MDELKGNEVGEEALQEQKKGRIDYYAFFMAPLFLLITTEIMHLSHFEGYPQFFGNPYFLLKWLISYLFLLGMQGVLLVVIPNLAVVHTLQTVLMWTMGMVTEVLMKITGDPLLPSDLLLMDNMGEIASFVEIPLLAQCVVSALFGVFSIIYFFRRRKTRKSKIGIKARIALSLAVIILFSGSVYAMCFNRIVKYRFFESIKISIAAFNPQADYYANGLVLTFFPRIGELKFDKPKGYSEEAIEELKSKDNGEIAYTEIMPNVIAIQTEALWDVTRLPGTTFSEDPLINMRKIAKEKNAKMGDFISPVFAGGTCMPEFEFLTGLSTNFLPASVYPYIQAVSKPTPSLVSSFKDNGYQTYALHPYKKNFYGRNKAYPLMGFEKFEGDEDLENPEIGGYYIADMEVTRQLIKQFENKEKDRIFAFAVTMQNHGGYSWERYGNYDVEFENPMLDSKHYAEVKEYVQGVVDSDKAFGALVDYFRNVSEPVVIVMYGDHLPLLGENGRPYTDTGFIETTEKFRAIDHPELFETPYIVWANYDVDLSEFEDDISPANLGLSIYKLAGLKDTPWYYSFIDRFYKEYPVYTPNKVENKLGVAIEQTEPELKSKATEYKYVQYDLLHGKRYAEQ